MKLRTLVLFNSSISCDEDAYPIGRTLALALADELRAFFPDAVSELYNPNGKEWCMDISFRDGKIVLAVGLVDNTREWMVTTHFRRSLWDIVFRRELAPQQRMVCDALHRVLHEDARFSDLQWFTECDWEANRLERWSMSPHGM